MVRSVDRLYPRIKGSHHGHRSLQNHRWHRHRHLHQSAEGLLHLGLAALARVEAIELATTALKELVARIEEGGTLAVWGDEGPTIVRWLRGGGIGVTSLGLGTIFPLLSSATGQVFLAHLPARNTAAQLKRELGNEDPRVPTTAARIDAILRSPSC